MDTDKEHQERILLKEYKGKLSVENEVLPDPIDLLVGWIGEKDGMALWPNYILQTLLGFMIMF